MKRRLTALLLCVLMALTFTAEAVHAGHHHDEAGNDCPVCEMIRTKPEAPAAPADAPAGTHAVPVLPVESKSCSVTVYETAETLQKMNVRRNS